MQRFNVQLSLAFLLSFLIAFSCSKKYHLSDVMEDRYEIKEKPGLVEDQEIVNIIAPFKKELEAIMGKQIGIASMTMYKNRPESTLGNWFVDIVQEEAQKIYDGKVDFTLQNYGGIRVQSLAAGPITIGEIFEIMPFENQLVILEAKGVTVNRLFEHISRLGGWPVSKEVQVKVARDGQVRKLLINGVKIDPAATYHFALPDYIANGGDRCSFLKTLKRVETGKKIRDVVIDHLEKSGIESIEMGEIDNRYSFVN